MKILFQALIAAALLTGSSTPRASAQGAAVALPPATNAPAVIAPAVTPAAAPIVAAATNAAVVLKTNAPAKPKAPVKKAAAPVVKKPVKPAPIAEVAPAPVPTPEPAAAKQDNINVRGQATIGSEVITHLKKGEPITLLEVVTIKKPKQDEPANWYRIALPPHVSVWIHSSYVDTNTSVIKARKLNLRAGPGENFSIVGRMEKGTTVKVLETKEEWLKIITPTNAFGFVAAHLIERTPVAIAIVPVVTKTNEIAVVPPTTETVGVVPGTVVGDAPPVAPPIAPPVITPPTPPVLPPADVPIIKVKKVVSREGILKGSVSIQAPSYFELRALDTGKTINYVFSTNVVLYPHKGQRVIVTGEEVLDERWQLVPVIIVDALETVPTP